jgi:ABC-type branched-subunit amino acid transport system substrate-binding protein
VTDNQIVLGQSVALTGPAQQLGLDMQIGATLYFNKVNAKGGVNGRKIVLKTLDDGYEPPATVDPAPEPRAEAVEDPGDDD